MAILGYGSIVPTCLMAADTLRNHAAVFATVADARFCKPLDGDLIRRLATEHEILITVEEGSIGGFGSHVAHFLSSNGLLDGHLKVKKNYFFSTSFNCFLTRLQQLRSMVLPDRYIEHGSPQDQIEEAGLSSTHVAATVLALLGRPKEAMQLK